MSVEKPGLFLNGLAGSKTAELFFTELEQMYNAIPDNVGIDAGTILAKILASHTVNGRANRLTMQLALLLAVSANMAADLVAALEPAIPLNEARHDGRLKAVRRCFDRILDDAVYARVAARLMNNVGGTA